MTKGSKIELEIDSLAFGADGVARHEGMVVFVAGALPGQRVEALITRRKKSHAYGRLLEVIRPSPHAATPRCAHFSDCGGCVLQHCSYAYQLEAKATQVSDTLARIGGYSEPLVRPALPAPEPFYYRNKMEYTFGDRRWLSEAEIAQEGDIIDRNFALGLHIRGRYDKILALNECHLQSEASNGIRNKVAEVTRGSAFRPYTTRDHSGFWRFLVLREGKNTGESMVILVTADRGAKGEAEAERVGREVLQHFPDVTTLVHAVNSGKAQVATGDSYRTLHGPGYIMEKLGNHSFRISPESFFQTNTKGAERLYQQVREYAGLTGRERVLDLYCGAGSIAIALSDSAASVVGVEVVAQAVRDAKSNAELNNAANCEFYCGDLNRILSGAEIPESLRSKPDLIVLDPPRAGLHPEVVRQVLNLSPAKIVYVSCNPSTYARDCALFRDGGYTLRETQPVDMFPHTAHIEVVGLLERP